MPKNVPNLQSKIQISNDKFQSPNDDPYPLQSPDSNPKAYTQIIIMKKQHSDTIILDKKSLTYFLPNHSRTFEIVFENCHLLITLLFFIINCPSILGKPIISPNSQTLFLQGGGGLMSTLHNFADFCQASAGLRLALYLNFHHPPTRESIKMA